MSKKSTIPIIAKSTKPIMALVALSLLLFAACDTTANASFKTQGEAFIRENIEDLSPRQPLAGARFTVRTIEWVDDDTALVTFTDGSRELRGHVDLMLQDSQVKSKTRIKLDADINDDDGDDGENEDDDDDGDDGENGDDDDMDDDGEMSATSSSMSSSL